MPVLTIVAGSNGSGKTTLTTSAREEFQSNPILDPDAIAKAVASSSKSGTTAIEAGKQVLRRAEELLKLAQSFTVETTLSGNTYLRMASAARNAGFSVTLIFVGTDSVEINMKRIRGRVDKGGHDVSEEDQRRRWPRTMANLLRLIPSGDSVVLLDNSKESGFELIATGNRGRMTWYGPTPEWARFS